MNDHLLPIDRLLEKYKISGVPRQAIPLLDHTRKNLDRKVSTNQVFPARDHNILFLLTKAIVNPVTIVSLISVTGLVTVYFFNKEEKEHLLVFIFTVTILVIFIAFEVYEEIRVNNIYRQNLQMLESRIIKDKHVVSINTDFLDIGDVLYLKAGDTVGADSVLIDSNDLSIDRKKMIGETLVLKKDYAKSSDVFESSDNVVLGSDYVLTGSAKAVVVRVGKESKIGKLYNQYKKSSVFKSKIETEISIVFTISLILSLVISSIFTVFALINGAGVFDLVNLIFSTFLCIIPECIPNTIKILQLSVTRKLNAKGLVVRDVDIVERMGLVTMICADKKALLPPDHIFVGSVYDGWQIFDIELTFSDQDSVGLAFLRKLNHILGYVSQNKTGKYKKYYHDPLAAFSDVLNGYFVDFYGNGTKIKDFRFHGLDGTILEHTNYKSVYVSGTVESILKICTKVNREEKNVKLRSARKLKILQIVKLFEDKGYKCIGLAHRSYSKSENMYSLKGCQFGGIIFFEELPVFDTPIFTNVLKSSGISFSIISESNDKKQLFSCYNILGFTEDNDVKSSSFNNFENEHSTISQIENVSVNNHVIEMDPNSSCETSLKAKIPYQNITLDQTTNQNRFEKILPAVEYGAFWQTNEKSSLKYPVDEKLKNKRYASDSDLIGESKYKNKKVAEHIYAKSEQEQKIKFMVPCESLNSKDNNAIRKRILSYNSSSMPNLTFLNNKQNEKLESLEYLEECPKTKTWQEYGKFSSRKRFEFLQNEKFIVYNCRNSDKKLIIEDLIRINHVVCFVGLDINDAEALSVADVGICFSSSGLIGQESSNVVLESFKFSHILTYIEEGRLFYVNLKKSIKYILMHITPQLLALAMYAFLGTPPPISSIMLLLLNYLVEMIPATYFAYEEPEYNLMLEPPTNKIDVSEMPSILNVTNTEPLSRTTALLNKIRYVMTNGAIYQLNTITWSILIAGLLSSASCIAAFFSVFIMEEVPLRSLFFDVRNYFVHGGQDLLLKNGKIINYERQLEILHKAQCTFFVGMIICQFFNMIVCRREKEYFFYKFFNNPRILIFTTLGIAFSLLIVCSAVFDKFLLLKRPVALPLIFPFVSSIAILIIDTGKKFYIKNYKH